MENREWQDVLDFWFGGMELNPEAVRAHHAFWFMPTPEQDDMVRLRFGGLVARALGGGLQEWKAEPESRLALILLLDQFPRQIHRGTAQAFAGDEKALKLSREGIELGMDQKLDFIQRAFFYLPLQHAEDVSVQQQCVAHYERLVAEAPAGVRAALAEEFLTYAREHKEIIEQFGRFPHRNAALKRENTAAEIDFLRKPHRSYGQLAAREGQVLH